MIVYLDSTVLGRAYLSDEAGHDEAAAMLANTELGLITGTWTRIETSGALVRAARSGRGDEAGLLALFDSDLSRQGPVTVVTAAQEDIERRALDIVRTYAVRAMVAWHVAVATLVAPKLVEPGEQVGFATRDAARSALAEALGLHAV